MAYLFKLSSRLIVERHLPTIASDAYGIGFVEETCSTRDQYCGCVATVSDRNFFTAFGRTHWARNFVCFFPFRLGLYIKGQDWIWFFVAVVIFLHFFIDSAQDTCKHT